MQHNFDNIPEAIDGYIRGELSASERHALEEMANQDPGLANEMTFQQQLVSGLTIKRHAQLKARLNNIDVSNLPKDRSLSNRMAAAGAGLVAGAVLIAYLWQPWAENTNTIDTDNAPVKVEMTMEPVAPAAEVTTPILSPDNETENVEPTAKEQAETKSADNKQVVATDFKEAEEPIAIENSSNKVATPPTNLPSFDGNDEQPTVSGGTEDFKPVTNAASSPADINTGLQVSIQDNSKLAGKYKVENGKLYLYDKAFAASPYQIVDMIVDGKNHLYLYHNNKFYEVHKTTELKTLGEVKDYNLNKRLHLELKK